MTNEEAVKVLKRTSCYECAMGCVSASTCEGYNCDLKIATNMAIKALEQQPCEDCISREEAIRIAEQGQIQGYEWQFKKLCTLPSVIPKAENEAYNKGYTDAMRDIGDTQ
jgi:hypothetical protein